LLPTSLAVDGSGFRRTSGSQIRAESVLLHPQRRLGGCVVRAAGQNPVVRRTADGYAPIRDYALIGDGRTTALVATDGSVDWLCLPNVDSPSVFARIVDSSRGGSFQLEPAVPYESSRRYLPGSNVLETTFQTAAGSVRLTDAMNLSNKDHLSPLRELCRKVEGLAGAVPLRWRFEPRFDYGRDRTRLSRRGAYWVAEHRTEALALGAWDAGEPALEGDDALVGEFRLQEGSSAILSLAAAHEEPLVLPGRDDAELRLERTIEFWPRWSERCEYAGSWRDAVVRSALVLKLLVFSPSGAIVAAPTASLPEWIGGSRNWDYRFTWLRDASWTLDALIRLGIDDEAHAFFWWLMHASRLTQPRMQILYRVDGNDEAREHALPDLLGYRGSAPVRIGNGAVDQVQLDVYGFVLESIWLYAQHVGHLDGETGREVAKIADYVCQHWRNRDSGIWEVRSEPTHFTQSKALCWVALDRACSLAERGLIPNRAEGWRAEADEIRAFVEVECWSDEQRSYVRAPDLQEIDASLLTLAILSYDYPVSERVQATIEAVRRELQEGPFVFRYRGEDGVPGDEGAFLTCSFWLVDALARQGELDEARSLMDELVATANDVGLYSEEIDPRSRELLGNFPQGLTHLALINAAISIEDASSKREAA
jgi:GH15 family glucan-1,4-alpha-glucosidase